MEEILSQARERLNREAESAIDDIRRHWTREHASGPQRTAAQDDREELRRQIEELTKAEMELKMEKDRLNFELTQKTEVTCATKLRQLQSSKTTERFRKIVNEILKRNSATSSHSSFESGE